MKAFFFRLQNAGDKAAALRRAIQDASHRHGTFEVSPSTFGTIQGSPFSYWVSDRVRNLFHILTPLEGDGRTAQVGVATGDDQRFVRAWWAVGYSERTRWLPFAKGGAFSPFYADLHLLVDWLRDGLPIELSFVGGRVRKALFLRPGIVWPRRTNGLSFRLLPRGCIFSDKSPLICTNDDRGLDLLALVAILNSSVFVFLVSLQLARTELAQSFEVGLVQSTPVPLRSKTDDVTLGDLAREAWSLKRFMDESAETSHAFALPALLRMGGADVSIGAASWLARVRTGEADFAAILAEIEDRCFALYEIEEIDRRAIIEGLRARGLDEASSGCVSETEDDADGNEAVVDSIALVSDLVSWEVGVAFGRFDVRLSTGVRALPAEPEPFDPLPVCSQGMLTGVNGLPLNHPPVGYPVGFPETGVLVDDPGHPRDLNGALRVVFEIVFGADADRWWNDVASMLDPKNRDLRVWLAGSFFEHHLKRYSKSRRKAPIYWQLATPSASYSLWLYAHRLTGDSFFQIQKDIVAPKLMHEESELARFTRDAGQTPTSEQRKAIAEQDAFVTELRAFRDEIARVAPLWNPNLDDGVVITSAPLWRLFPHHKAWQKGLKGYWDDLCAGKYNWSHVAMHLWPERVVPNCATDRSIAIAHDLEEVFWVEDAKGKWKPRPNPTRSVEELVAERTSPAVKAALKSLLEAPVANGTSTKRRSRRK